MNLISKNRLSALTSLVLFVLTYALIFKPDNLQSVWIRMLNSRLNADYPSDEAMQFQGAAQFMCTASQLSSHLGFVIIIFQYINPSTFLPTPSTPNYS